MLYHTLSGLVKAANVPAGPDAAMPTAGGDSVYVTNNSKGGYINGIKVVTPDVAASNGVIHVIGRVLLPPSGILFRWLSQILPSLILLQQF